VSNPKFIEPSKYIHQIPCWHGIHKLSEHRKFNVQYCLLLVLKFGREPKTVRWWNQWTFSYLVYTHDYNLLFFIVKNKMNVWCGMAILKPGGSFNNVIAQDQFKLLTKLCLDIWHQQQIWSDWTGLVALAPLLSARSSWWALILIYFRHPWNLQYFLDMRQGISLLLGPTFQSYLGNIAGSVGFWNISKFELNRVDKRAPWLFCSICPVQWNLCKSNVK